MFFFLWMREAVLVSRRNARRWEEGGRRRSEGIRELRRRRREGGRRGVDGGGTEGRDRVGERVVVVVAAEHLFRRREAKGRGEGGGGGREMGDGREGRKRIDKCELAPFLDRKYPQGDICHLLG